MLASHKTWLNHSWLNGRLWGWLIVYSCISVGGLSALPGRPRLTLYGFCGSQGVATGCAHPESYPFAEGKRDDDAPGCCLCCCSLELSQEKARGKSYRERGRERERERERVKLVAQRLSHAKCGLTHFLAKIPDLTKFRGKHKRSVVRLLQINAKRQLVVDFDDWSCENCAKIDDLLLLHCFVFIKKISNFEILISIDPSIDRIHTLIIILLLLGI